MISQKIRKWERINGEENSRHLSWIVPVYPT